jgi:hypothetical protein
VREKTNISIYPLIVFTAVDDDDEDKENKPKNAAEESDRKSMPPPRGPPPPRSAGRGRGRSSKTAEAKPPKPQAYDLVRDLANGFERNLTPEEIVGSVMHDKRLLYLVKWKEAEEDDTDLVMASEANVKCPQVVIRYLEKLVTFRAQPNGVNGQGASIVIDGGDVVDGHVFQSGGGGANEQDVATGTA